MRDEEILLNQPELCLLSASRLWMGLRIQWADLKHPIFLENISVGPKMIVCSLNRGPPMDAAIAIRGNPCRATDISATRSPTLFAHARSVIPRIWIVHAHGMEGSMDTHCLRNARHHSEHVHNVDDFGENAVDPEDGHGESGQGIRHLRWSQSQKEQRRQRRHLVEPRLFVHGCSEDNEGYQDEGNHGHVRPQARSTLERYEEHHWMEYIGRRIPPNAHAEYWTGWLEDREWRGWWTTAWTNRLPPWEWSTWRGWRSATKYDADTPSDFFISLTRR